MGGERGGHDLGHGHRSESGPALRRAERGNASQRRDELAVDAHLAAEEVDPIHGQAEALALPHAHPGAKTIKATSLTDRGTTSASLRLGSVIPMQGEEASMRSPTAALKIVATHR